MLPSTPAQVPGPDPHNTGTAGPSPVRATAVAAMAVLAIATLAAATAPAATTPAAAARPPGPPVPALAWHPCDSGFQCATARVPLNYRHPHGAMISIAVIRHRATDPAHRIGSLFTNGGGPNPQVADFPGAYARFPAPVRARFDLVTFDPRGFGYSTAVRCFPSMAAENRFLAGLPAGFPTGKREDSVWERTWARFDARCATRRGPLVFHDTTADVARDMNLLRQAVGDPVLNYYGASYGTFLGATYANLFPATVGRMILDGNVDPVAWTHPGPPNWLRLGRDRASAAAMTAFLNLCGKAATTACAFSAGTPRATRTKFATLLRRLRRHPVTIGNPPRTYTYALTVSDVPLGTVRQWPAGARLLQRLWTIASRATAAGRARHSQPAHGTPAHGTPAQGDATARAAYSGQEQPLAVLCSDSPNPSNPKAYPGYAARAYARAGGFGPEYTWDAERCARWPAAAAQDRYSGPWDRRTAGAILLLGNTGDPDTPYEDSVALAHDLARARLLTVRGYGHTEGSNPSTCATRYAVRYALTGALPPPGTICTENLTPFAQPARR